MAPSFYSPGTYVIEKDISEYAPTVDSTVVGIVGFASRGPMNEATLITSPQSLVNTFGRPDENIPGQGLIGALEILEATNKVVFVRAGSEATSVEASTIVDFGACPAAYVEFSGIGVTLHGSFLVQVYNQNGIAQYDSPKQFDVLSGTTTAALGTSAQAYALINAFGNGSLDQAKVGVHMDSASSFIVGSWAGSGAYMGVSAFTDSTLATGRPCLRALNQLGQTGALVSSLGSGGAGGAVSGITFRSAIQSSGMGYFAQSLYPGAGYNLSTLADGTVVGLSLEVDALGGANSLFTVNDGGAAVENYKVGLLNNAAYIEDVINVGTVNPTSDLIQGYLVSGATVPLDFTNNKLATFAKGLSDLGLTGIYGNYNGTEVLVTPKFIKPVEGTYSFVNGSNGTGTSTQNATALIGDSAAEPKTGMQALDDDILNVSIACVPGFYDQSVQNALVTLAERTQNFLAVLSVPYGIGNAQAAIDWSNGLSESRTAALTSNYAALYYPHVKVFSVYDGVDRDYSPDIFACRQMVFTDSVAETWFAPAGTSRGRLTKPTEVEVKLNQGDRDSLYSGGNRVNPIVNFPQQGIMIFGQRTCQPTASALDRVNIRRLMILIRKLFLAATRIYVFEPNDPATWERVEGLLNPLLDDIKNRRGITEFRVVCDETTNTPLRVDRNEMWTKVLIKPTKTAEMIVFELNLVSQSTSIAQ